MCVCIFVLATNTLILRLMPGHFVGSEDIVTGPHDFNIQPMKVLIKSIRESVCVRTTVG